jgi:hypothetical protein
MKIFLFYIFVLAVYRIVSSFLNKQAIFIIKEMQPEMMICEIFCLFIQIP